MSPFRVALSADFRKADGSASFPEFDLSPLREAAGLDNVIVAPHALCWTDQLFAGSGRADIEAVLDVKNGRVPSGIVNKDIVENASWRARLASNAQGD